VEAGTMNTRLFKCTNCGRKFVSTDAPDAVICPKCGRGRFVVVVSKFSKYGGEGK